MNSSFKIIPENTKGKHTDVEHSFTAGNREEALDIFKRAAKRMLNINIWHQLGGFATADFFLTDTKGETIERLGASGDFIKIDIQGPGPSVGDGYDWVRIEALEDRSDPGGNEESIAMRLRSCKKPGQEGDDTAHFFTSDATSTFIIYRKQNEITSFYHGRNEVLNTDTAKTLDNLRNILMGGVALIGVSELQWSALIKSFLEREV